MKPTDFAEKITDFFNSYLIKERNLSHNTIRSYRDTFKLFLEYMMTTGIKPEKVKLKHLSAENIRNFLFWLEENRLASVSTRNQRMTALKSFLRFLQIECPEHLFEIQKSLAIRKKKTQKQPVQYLSISDVQALLKIPDARSRKGLRDLAILSLLYDSGCRVQELIDLTVDDLNCDKTPTIKVIGKGNKARLIPISDQVKKILLEYLNRFNLQKSSGTQYSLFFNPSLRKLTPEGVNYILKKYYKTLKIQRPKLPETIHCHILRHSKAMHLLNSGVNLVYIRDFLGHESVTATQIYAKADAEQKKRAIIEASTPVWVDTNLPDWNKVSNLEEVLGQLCKR